MAAPKIVIGLGNPGPKYDGTRHNLGFEIVDRLAGAESWRNLGWWSKLCWYSKTESGLVLAKPRTFMNRSGDAAVAICRRFGAGPADLLVVYDDADLGLGRVRLRKSGGSGGHNGLRSIADVLESGEFPRLRLGVRGRNRSRQPLADYVLDRFEPEERTVADGLISLAVAAIREIERNGFEMAMNRYNGRSAAPRESERSAEEEE